MCEKLKIIYFNDVHWQACYKQVANKFTELKQIMRKFYNTDKNNFDSEIEMLKELSKFSKESIKEALESST